MTDNSSYFLASKSMFTRIQVFSHFSNKNQKKKKSLHKYKKQNFNQTQCTGYLFSCVIYSTIIFKVIESKIQIDNITVPFISTALKINSSFSMIFFLIYSFIIRNAFYLFICIFNELISCKR